MPDQAPPPGLYQQLLTEGLEQHLRQLQQTLVATECLDPQEAPRLLARHLAGLARIALEHLSGGATPEHQLALVNQLVGLLQSQAPRAISTADLLHPCARLLSEIRSTALLPGQAATIRPLIPLADSTLLVNASGEPSVGQALIHEIPSAQRIDLLCAFIKWSGLRLLQPALSEFLQAQPHRPLRVLTTVYLGATDRRALDWLVDHGAEVRVSYDTRRTRLHAKAWLFHRPGLTVAPPASTAYIGSSNLSTAALHDGLEWNVRLSAHDNEGIVAKFQAAFESYWEEGEFEPYRSSELEQRRFDRAVREESAGGSAADATPLSFFDIRPYAYQQEILDKLSAERSLHGRWRNLVVAATGTGKTVVAALDYARQGGPGHPSLLFVAHRREILQQSLATFRQVLRDGSFGELLVDRQRPSQWRHVFASVQSLAGLDPADLAQDTFDVVIVDEFHHAASASYERWLRHLSPVLLLGLTATPERTGGEDILHWFDGRIAAELRLWSALEQGLLTPFHYFGLHDGTDLSRIEWRRNGYATEALSNMYTADDARLHLILRELADKVTNLASMRALGFCVSVEHAHWMARKFVAAGLRAVALDASSPREQRTEQIRRLRCGELQILFAMVFLQTATVQRGPRHPRDRHGAVPAAHRERHRVPAAARPGVAPAPVQKLPHGAGFHRPGPPQLPLRSALPRSARRHARPAQTADRSGLSLPAGRLQLAARSCLQRPGACQFARVAAHAPTPAARRGAPPRALFAGGVAGGAWDGAGGVLQGGGLLGIAAAGVGVGGDGGGHRGAQRR